MPKSWYFCSCRDPIAPPRGTRRHSICLLAIHPRFAQCGAFWPVTVSGHYAALYDQAGLMVRVDETHWIKCGVEFIDEVQHASAVVTREYSDWSVVPLPQNPASLWLRLKREGSTVEIQYALDGTHYQLLRQAYLSEAETMSIGLMCASPVGAGFSVAFEGFTVQSL